jgi:hypothetical protein
MLEGDFGELMKLNLIEKWSSHFVPWSKIVIEGHCKLNDWFLLVWDSSTIPI